MGSSQEVCHPHPEEVGDNNVASDGLKASEASEEGYISTVGSQTILPWLKF